MVYGVRGGVVAVVATMGVIISTDAADVPRRDDHGPAGRLDHEEARQASGTARSSPASRCWSTTSPPASPAALLAVVGFFAFGPIIAGISQRARQRRRLADRTQPAAAGQPDHRAGQGAVPQQRHQPRRADPAGHQPGRRRGQVDPVPARGEPRPGPRSAAGLLHLRHRAGQEHRTRPPRSSSSSAASTRSTSRTC